MLFPECLDLEGGSQVGNNVATVVTSHFRYLVQKPFNEAWVHLFRETQASGSIS